jgi:hypothetical protein
MSRASGSECAEGTGSLSRCARILASRESVGGLPDLGSSFTFHVLAPVVKELAPMFYASQTVGFKAILGFKSSVNLDRMYFLLVEKLNDNLLLMESDKY